MTLLTAGLVVLALAARTDTTLNVAPSSRLKLENFGGDIQVQTWSRNAVRIEADHGRRVDVTIDRSSGELTLGAETRFGAPATVDWRLTVPATLSLELSGVYSDVRVDGVSGEVRVETVQGDVTITGNPKEVSASSVQGQVRIEGGHGRIEASSVNERVTLLDASGEIQAESVNGDVLIRGGGSDRVEASTVNGNILFEAAFAKSGEYSFSSHGGGLYVAVPQSADVEVSVSTYQGSFESTFPYTSDSRRKRDFSFTLGSGDARLDLESFQGEIRLFRPGESVPDLPDFFDREDSAGHGAKSKAKSEVKASLKDKKSGSKDPRNGDESDEES